MRRSGVLPENARDVIAALTFKIVLPFFIIKVLYGVKFDGANSMLPLYALIITIGAALVCYYTARLMRMSRPKVGSVALTSLAFSVGGFVPPFIISAGFSEEILSKVLLLDVIHFLFYMIAGYIIAIQFGDKVDGGGGFQKVFVSLAKNPIILTLLGVFVVNYSGLSLPGFVLDTADYIGGAFSLFATFLLGLTLRMPDQSAMFNVFSIFAVRVAAVFLIVFGISFLFDVSEDNKVAMLLTFMAPFATLPVVYAEEQGTDSAIISQLALFSSIVVLILYPVLMAWLA